MRQARREIGIDLGMRRLDERGFAHAARAPEQRIIGGQALRKTLGISLKISRTRSMPRKSPDLDPAHMRHGLKQLARRMPDESIGGGEGWRLGLARRQSFERDGDPLHSSCHILNCRRWRGCGLCLGLQRGFFALFLIRCGHGEKSFLGRRRQAAAAEILLLLGMGLGSSNKDAPSRHGSTDVLMKRCSAQNPARPLGWTKGRGLA